MFDTLQKFSNMLQVSFAEPSEFGLDDTAYIPDDEHFKNLWGLHNIGQIVNVAPGSTDADIDMPHAWDIGQGDRNVIVKVIDTGCDMDHPDLKNNLLPRGLEDWDFADPNDESPDDSGSHGTHVAGTAAAVFFPICREDRLEVVSKPPLEPNLGVGKKRLILKIPVVFLRLNGFHRLDLGPD